MKVKKHLKFFSFLFLIFGLIFISSSSVSGKGYPKGREIEWWEQGYNFYNPNGSNCVWSGNAGGNSGEDNGSESGGGGLSGGSRLYEYTKKLGSYAMSLQKKYGTPWEVIFAQMQHESSMGTLGVAVSGATNNWLGITGTGDAGYYKKCSECRKWAKFSSLEAMMDAWAGRKVLRNGYYNAAFQYLDPNNYDLHNFLKKMISIYAPASDGNDVANYINKVEGYINGTIRQVRQEMGWPSSAELAKQQNIGIGGDYPIGGNVPGGGGGGGDDGDSDGGDTNYCLDENEGGSTGTGGELVSGGMNLQQAQEFMQPYINRAKLREKGTVNFDGATVNQPSGGAPKDGTLNNCSAFSQWFSNRYTSAATVGLYQGSATVSRLLSLGRGYVNGGHTPKVYAIFSNNSPNHTGVVLGIDKERNKIIIGEASYHNGLNGYPRAKEYDLSKYTNNPHITYAYTDNIIKGL
ncbi:glucosaminidase domain-containing protein [Candidatus Saccharibacteria bacterium]|nr:glucosaminidase domain-containing protein [Candidatus Saccharibacteria bacterium]